MIQFQDIIGREDVIAFLQKSIASKRVSHSYIFSGETGSGKQMIANTFAAALQCEKGGTSPCMQCESCRWAIGKNHPDIITVTHEKENIITIDEVRKQLVSSVPVKPYRGPYKVFIVPDAHLMRVDGQNALLKTLEEPPAYAVIILLTTNIDALLPTIQSRCVRLDLKLVEEKLIKQYLMEHLHIPDYEAEIDASFGQGNVGRASKAAQSEEFREVTQKAVQIIKSANNVAIYELTDSIQKITENKTHINDYLDLFQFWYRDVLMYKATREIDNLVFKQELSEIRSQAKSHSYEKLEKILSALEITKVRLAANVNPELTLELLLMTIREK